MSERLTEQNRLAEEQDRRDKTLPKKGLLPGLPPTVHDTGSLKPELVPSDSSVAATIKKVQETFRLGTDTSLTRAVEIACEQQNLDYMSADELEGRIIYTFEKETREWLEKFKERNLIRHMITQGRIMRKKGKPVDFSDEARNEEEHRTK